MYSADLIFNLVMLSIIGTIVFGLIGYCAAVDFGLSKNRKSRWYKWARRHEFYY